MVDSAKSEVTDVGRVAGGAVGLIGGAKIGTLAIPVPVVGTFVGAVLGGVVGSEAGGLLVRALANVGGIMVQAMSNVTGKAAGALRTAATPRT